MANKPIMGIRWNMKNTQFFKKRQEQKNTQKNKNRTNRSSKMLHLKPIILIITLNIKGLHPEFLNPNATDI